MGQLKNGLLSPDKQRKHEEELMQLKMEQNQQVERFNFEMLESNRRETEVKTALQFETKKYQDLLKDHEALKDSKQVHVLINNILT